MVGPTPGSVLLSAALFPIVGERETIAYALTFTAVRASGFSITFFEIHSRCTNKNELVLKKCLLLLYNEAGELGKTSRLYWYCCTAATDIVVPLIARRLPFDCSSGVFFCLVRILLRC